MPTGYPVQLTLSRDVQNLFQGLYSLHRVYVQSVAALDQLSGQNTAEVGQPAEGRDQVDELNESRMIAAQFRSILT